MNTFFLSHFFIKFFYCNNILLPRGVNSCLPPPSPPPTRSCIFLLRNTYKWCAVSFRILRFYLSNFEGTKKVFVAFCFSRFNLVYTPDDALYLFFRKMRKKNKCHIVDLKPAIKEPNSLII